MLMTQNQLEAKAFNAGYSDFWEGYVEDKDFAKCQICHLWGKFGEDVVGDGMDNYCEEHRPVETE